MKRTLKRIAPVKFGLILGIMYGALSLIIVPFFLLFSLMSFFVPQQSSSEMGHLAPALGLVMTLAFCIFLPVFYAVIGGLMGMLMAWVYNVTAGWLGGFEFEVE
jgi:hypothetical protein